MTHSNIAIAVYSISIKRKNQETASQHFALKFRFKIIVRFCDSIIPNGENILLFVYSAYYLRQLKSFESYRSTENYARY